MFGHVVADALELDAALEGVLTARVQEKRAVGAPADSARYLSREVSWLVRMLVNPAG